MDLYGEFSLRISIEVAVMNFWQSNRIEKVWENIVKCEGELFLTVTRKKPYTYVVKDNYILVNNDTRRKITKSAFEKALTLISPTPSKIQKENIWGPSYVCGIIPDSRIL